MTNQTVHHVGLAIYPPSGHALYIDRRLVYQSNYLSANDVLDLLMTHGVIDGFAGACHESSLTDRGQFPDDWNDIKVNLLSDD